jgi:transcriptional regulator with XRE-family HTH domain
VRPRELMSFGARFGALVRYKRGLEGLTQEALAEIAFEDGEGKARISMLENGRISRPQQRTVDALAVALNIGPEEIQACHQISEGESSIRTLDVGLVSRSEVASNMGDTLVELGVANEDASLLKEALAIYQEILVDTSRTENPAEWAYLQNRIGLALQAIGKLTGDTRSFVEAIDAFRSALAAVDRT